MTGSLLRSAYLTALLAAFPLTATIGQDVTVIIGKPPADGPRSFGGSGATPISSTAVIQFLLEPRDSGGGQLAYAIVIRGEPNWYRRPTSWTPTDTVPGFEAVNWDVGDVRYVVAYSQSRRLLRTFGTETDLTKANLILVSLGPNGVSDATVSGAARYMFVLLTPGGFVQHFLSHAPEVRRFAGLEESAP